MQAFIILICISFFISVIINLRQGGRRYLCMSCEQTSRGVYYKRSTWAVLLLGPLSLLTSKKMTCRHCKGHELIPANSAKAIRLLAAK